MHTELNTSDGAEFLNVVYFPILKRDFPIGVLSVPFRLECPYFYGIIIALRDIAINSPLIGQTLRAI